MSKDAEQIEKTAWDDIKYWAMCLATEMQADDTVAAPTTVTEDNRIFTYSSRKNIKLLDSQIRHLEDAIGSRDLGKLTSCIAAIKAVGYADEEIYWHIEEIEGLYDLIDVYEAKLVYTAEQNQIVVPELIIPVRESLASLARKNPSSLYAISSRQFEELVAEIFEKRGFAVELTKATRDGGKDIIAISTYMGIRMKYIIECKRYARDNKVSLDVVQRLYGVKVSENANKAILVTTSDYTRDAKKFGSQHRWDLELKDRDDILGWLKGYQR